MERTEAYDAGRLAHIAARIRISTIRDWRDSNGNEVDLLMNKGDHVDAVEIKSGQTYSMDFFKNLKYWGNLSGEDKDHRQVVYGGNRHRSTSEGELIPWNML